MHGKYVKLRIRFWMQTHCSIALMIPRECGGARHGFPHAVCRPDRSGSWERRIFVGQSYCRSLQRPRNEARKVGRPAHDLVSGNDRNPAAVTTSATLAGRGPNSPSSPRPGHRCCREDDKCGSAACPARVGLPRPMVKPQSSRHFFGNPDTRFGSHPRPDQVSNKRKGRASSTRPE